MPNIWHRHPRLTLFTLGALICTLYILYPTHEGHISQPTVYILQEHNLANSVARADRIYQKAVSNRQALIKRFGPTPKDITLFPPDISPWPAYTVWDFFPPAFNCPHEVERIGGPGGGGQWVCGLSRLAEREDCIIYSFGNNYEASWEAEVLQNTHHCKIWGYDFRAKSFGPEITKAQAPRTHFHRFGLSGTDQHGPNDTPPIYTLSSLMKINGHTHIDILKIDIEGWEFETLTAILKPYLTSLEHLPFGQLLLEIHIWNKTFPELLTWWESLEAAGLRPFWAEPNLVYQNYNKQGTTDLAQYSFLNIRGNNIFVKELMRPASYNDNHGDDLSNRATVYS